MPLHENVAWSVPEKDTGAVTVTPGGTEKVFPGATAPVFVARGPLVAVPLNNVVPAGAPPPPDEFANAL